ncbi:TPA: hypothetical protein GF185_11095 [Escherichia coli]|nr:hypothetical protein [Escherichia coli]
MFSASITLLNGSPFHSPVTRKCIYHLHKTKLAVASSDKRNPREFEDCYSLPIFTFIANTFTGLSPKCGCFVYINPTHSDRRINNSSPLCIAT